MPWNASTNTISRIWRFIDRFDLGEIISRTEHDVALDDVHTSVNSAVAYLVAQINAVAANNLYLGAGADFPTELSGGEPLVVGNTFVKTPGFVGYVWNGSEWVLDSQFGPASTYFKGLVSAEDAAALRALLQLGSASTFASSSFAPAAAAPPVGHVLWHTGNAAPAGYIKANGPLLLRADFPQLWAFAQASGNLVTEASWEANRGSYSSGDGSTTFRAPDFRAWFPRFWDDGRGVDAGRVMGSTQAQEIQSHSHAGTTNVAGAHNHNVSVQAANIQDGSRDNSYFRGDGGLTTYTTTTNGNHTHTFTTDPTGGAETRPANVALLGCIKF